MALQGIDALYGSGYTPHWLQGFIGNSGDLSQGQQLHGYTMGANGAPQWWLSGDQAVSHSGMGDASQEQWAAPQEFRSYADSPAAKAAHSGLWSRLNGTPYDSYNAATGERSGTGTWSGLEDSDSLDQIMMAAVGAALGGIGAFGGAGGVASGVEGAGVAGVGDAGWGMGLDSMGGIGGGSGAELLGGGGMAGGGGGMAAGGLDASLANGLNGADIMSDAFVSNGGFGAGGFGGTSGSYLSNLVNGTGSLGSRLLGGTGAGTGGGGAASTIAKAVGGGNGLLGTGASLLGGLLGSQGQEQESSSVRDIPAWLKPSVQDNIAKAMALRDQQMSPAATAGWQNISNVGQGLLGQPIAGNGYGKVGVAPSFSMIRR